MVTGSKKPEASATKTKAAAKPKATVKAKTVASETAAKPKKTTAKSAAAKSAAAKTPTAKATAAKAATKPKKTTATSPTAKSAAAKAKTASKAKVIVNVPAARKVGEMVYNDELLEAMAEMVLRGSETDLIEALPEIKKQLFGYDIYLVSFLSDGEIAGIAGDVAKLCKADVKDLTDRMLTVREAAKVFVGIAGKHNSVRAYIDRAIEADGKEAGISRVKEAFLAGEYCISDVDSATCESFLMLF
jgi:chemotaxis protein histidine kinase CheA